MKIEEWLKKVAYVGKSSIQDDDGEVYYSKFDKSYITRVDMANDNSLCKFMAEHEITDELTHGVGFSPKEQKWYGWSHRTIYGFEIGSECKKGDCHYVADTPEQLINDHADFFQDISSECADQKLKECQILDDRSGIRILTTPIKINIASSISDIEDCENQVDLPEVNLFENDYYEIKCGRGEWIAKTLDDARQMAKDFNDGVS